MRVIALLSLIFGFMMQFLLDGQTFTHAVLGIVCGVAAVACGLASARKDRPNRWEGRIMAGLGLVLGVWCVVMLPSAYRFQEKFNGRREQRQKMDEQNRPANKSAPTGRPPYLRLLRKPSSFPETVSCHAFGIVATQTFTSPSRFDAKTTFSPLRSQPTCG